MNRRQRRKASSNAGKHGARFGALAAGYSCPDCISESALVNPSDGVFVLEVRHDATCPQLRKRGI